MLARSLIVGEPEYFVSDGWSTGSVAELVPLQNSAGVIEEAARIEVAVAEEIERAAVKAVGPRLGDGVHDSATKASVFRIEGIGDEAEFGNRIEVGDDGCSEVHALVYIAAIDKERI